MNPNWDAGAENRRDRFEQKCWGQIYKIWIIIFMSKRRKHSMKNNPVLKSRMLIRKKERKKKMKERNKEKKRKEKKENKGRKKESCSSK